MGIIGFILIVAAVLVVIGIVAGKKGVFPPSSGEISNKGLRDPGRGPG